MASVGETDLCPFCNGKIQLRQRESYIAGAKAELSRIILQLNGLTESENDICSNLNHARGKIHSLEERIDDINTLVDAELTPHAEKLRTAITQYRSQIQLQQEISVLHTISEDWNMELQKQDAIKNEDKPKFHPKEHFPEDFNSSLDEISHAILEYCQYEGLTSYTFIFLWPF